MCHSTVRVIEVDGHSLRVAVRPGYMYKQLAFWGWSSLPWLPLLPQPTLVLAGRDDPLVPVMNARILAALIPRARLEVVDDGHLLLLSNARSIAPSIRAFLAAA